ncbi:Fe-S cluster assembly protein SufD [Hyphobacterium marinum]|uniref:Fe-S cluster assembly protein SufD n=1 Tax=Hyphobacterium marinum TaxID=3116574 RepID=A0ABU7M1S9_9PROT|nr:Fe-S cluster assembly protein SufD [Hyphobacterium sp. Y6023]MEE2567773.1 Fe-S cluster assembly protein SufD [Hyphobacterium sp. Y6023]
MTAYFNPNAAESALIDALEGAEGWRAQLRDATQRSGFPTKRDEHWKWSDLRAATRGITQPGALAIEGAGEGVIEPADGARIDLTAHASAGASAADRTLVIKANRHVTLVERHAADDGALGNFHLKIDVEAGARLDRVILMPDSEGGVYVASAEIVLGEGASLNQTTLDFGGKLNRCETHVTHPGNGAEARLDAVYLLGKDRHGDQTSVVRHTGPGGRLSQLAKGAASSGGQGVFRGKIIVERAAQKTDARMTHRGLLLGDRAEIDAKPELEIYADDVQCAHGNALGAIDETALFYMRQRGLPEAKARALLIESFLAEPLDGIADEGLRDELRNLLRQRLEGLS